MRPRAALTALSLILVAVPPAAYAQHGATARQPDHPPVVATAATVAPHRQPALRTPRARRAFHRWIVGYWFARWLHGLELAELVACGGDLPPCYVAARESGFDPAAENPISTASGKWQFLDTTWNGYGGVNHAAFAPVAVQNAKAREVWAAGAGCFHWSAC